MTTRRWRGAALVDVVTILLFVVIGRASHHHGETAGGLASTLWPFAVGLGAGWGLLAAVSRRGRRRVSPSTLSGGAGICATTVVVGMVLRVISGQGTAPAFIAVAIAFLGALMLAGRAALATARRKPERGPVADRGRTR